jgi:signal transduction histidine kinase
VVRTAVESMHSLAYKEGINILANFPKGSPTVLCDRVKIEQVLLNLFRNSIKFTSRGGAITISVADHGAAVEVKVSDTGVGIPKDKLDILFEEKDPAQMRTADGGYRTSGLGLIIVKNILDAHNSKISVNSEISKGTQFSFTLPVVK